MGGTTSQIRFDGEFGDSSFWIGGSWGFVRTFRRSRCFTDSDPRRRATTSWKRTGELSIISNSARVKLRFPRPILVEPFYRTSLFIAMLTNLFEISMR